MVFVAHPDDPEYGMSAAVSRWVREGKRVEYVLATSGEAGIQGMPPDECGPLREEEQRRAAAHVGVDVVDFLGFPDSRLENTAELRVAVRSEIESRKPDLIVTLFTGPRFSPEIPNQSDHIEFGNAVLEAAAGSAHQARWVSSRGRSRPTSWTSRTWTSTTRWPRWPSTVSTWLCWTPTPRFWNRRAHRWTG